MKLIFFSLMITAVLSTTACSSNSVNSSWDNWRGPNYDGSAEGSGLPITFSQSENVKWQVNLGGTGASTPVISGNYIFLTAADLEKKELLAICVDKISGKKVWSKSVGSGYKPGGDGTEVRLGSRSTYASPSAVTDGKTVVFFFGNGDLVALSATDGKEVWRRNIQKDEGDFTFQWTFSATPTLFKGKVYLPVLQRDTVTNGRGKNGTESFILCYDVTDGKKLFKHVRPSDAKKESLEAYTTLIPAKIDGKMQLVLAGGDVFTGHDTETGKELWRWGTWNKNHREQWWRLVPSPVLGPDNIFLVCAPKKAPVYAIQIKEGKANLLWKSKERGKVTSDVPTPLYYKDHFYVLSDIKRCLSKINPKTGEVVWIVPAPGLSKYRSSPLGADGKIYLSAGDTCTDLCFRSVDRLRGT